MFFSYSSAKMYVVDTHLKCLTKALLMSTHKIDVSFGENRKYQYFLAEKMPYLEIREFTCIVLCWGENLHSRQILTLSMLDKIFRK